MITLMRNKGTFLSAGEMDDNLHQLDINRVKLDTDAAVAGIKTFTKSPRGVDVLVDDVNQFQAFPISLLSTVSSTTTVVSVEIPVNPDSTKNKTWIQINSSNDVQTIFFKLSTEWDLFTNPRKIVSFGWYTFIEKSDGTVWACGYNYRGQLGLGDTINRNVFTKIDTQFDNPSKIACGYNHTFIEKNDGTVWGCGWNGTGGLGLGNNLSTEVFTQLSTEFNNPNKIALGGGNTFIEKSDGTVWACGYNDFSQLGLGDTLDRNVFTQLPDVTFPSKIACGYNHTFIEKNDGTVWGCGWNGTGACGTGDFSSRSVFTQLSTEFNNPNKIALGGGNTFIEKSDGTVWACGYNDFSQLGLGDTLDRNVFTQLPVEFNHPNKIKFENKSTFIEKSDGTVWACGYNDSGQFGLGNEMNTTVFTQIPNIISPSKITTGNESTFIEKSDGTVWACGWNGNGELGLGDTINRNVFTLIPKIP
jgi:alpha-tubulin suppressor-like RCC1 family protein